MSDTYQPGQAVYVSATVVAVSNTNPPTAIVSFAVTSLFPGEVNHACVPLSSLSAAPSPQQIEDLRESIGDLGGPKL